MQSIKPAFARAAVPDTGFSTISLLVFAIAILDDEERREKERRRRPRQPQPPRKPPAPPGPG